MPRTISHISQAAAATQDIVTMVIPTPQLPDVAPSLDHVNAVVGPIVAGLVSQVAIKQAYIDALLASHQAKDQQIAALKARLASAVNGTEG